MTHTFTSSNPSTRRDLLGHTFHSALDVIEFLESNGIGVVHPAGRCEAWHLDPAGAVTCATDPCADDSLVSWASDPARLVDGFVAPHARAHAACGSRWVVIEYRGTWHHGEAIVDDGDVMQFQELRCALARSGVDLLDAIVLDDQGRWWSMCELLTGSVHWGERSIRCAAPPIVDGEVAARACAAIADVSRRNVYLDPMAERLTNRTSLVGIAATLLIGAALAVAGSSGSTQVGSLPVFALAGIIAFGINLAAYVPAAIQQTERFYDATGSVTYLTVTAVALLLSDAVDARAVVVAVLVVVWAVRLGSFLLARIRRDGRDGRFDSIKTDPLRFLMTWLLQGLWVFLTLACGLAVITAERREGFGVFAVVGVVVWAVGFGIEVIADNQKAAFRRDPANHDRFITTGLWAWSRHPNYFGEITLWVGIAIMALPVLEGWRWVTLISPVFVVVLLTRISGVPMLERRGRKKWGDDPDYQRYVERTPVLVPRPPR